VNEALSERRETFTKSKATKKTDRETGRWSEKQIESNGICVERERERERERL